MYERSREHALLFDFSSYVSSVGIDRTLANKRIDNYITLISKE